VTGLRRKASFWIAIQDPEQALELLPNPKPPQFSAICLIKAWRLEASQAAEAWLNQQGLSQKIQHHSQPPSHPIQSL